MRAGAPIDGGVIVEDVTDRLVVVTVPSQAAVLRLSDALWELDRSGDLAVYAAIVLAPLDGTYSEIGINCPDSVPSAREALRKLLDLADLRKRAPGDAGYAALVRAIAGLQKNAGAAVIAELDEDDPERLDEAVKAVDGLILRAHAPRTSSALHAEERLWTLRKKASRSEGDARRKHLERADRLSRAARSVGTS